MDLIEYIKQYGPWVALLFYYFFRLDRQMERVIDLLVDIRDFLKPTKGDV